MCDLVFVFIEGIVYIQDGTARISEYSVNALFFQTFNDDFSSCIFIPLTFQAESQVMLQFPPGTCSSLFLLLVLQGSLLCFRRLPWQHILQDIRLSPLALLGCHFSFLACISSSETLISSFSSGILMLMISPSSTRCDRTAYCCFR